MALTRALGVALGAAVTAAVLALPASAVPIPRPPGNHQITTPHFIVHYYTDMLNGAPGKDYSTETQAGDVAAYAERAYTLFTSWGYLPPVDDGDQHIDIYLADLSGPPTQLAYVEPDGVGPFAAPDSGAITLATPDQMGGFATAEGLSLADEETKTVAHELFNLIQFRTWVTNSQSDLWLFQGSAQWAGFGAIGFPAGSVVTNVGPPDIALNCRDNLPAHQMCDPDAYIEEGFSRWAFFELLADKYGKTFLNSVLANGAAGQTATTALSNAIAAKGSSLSDFFTDYANRLMTGNFGIPALASVRPPVHDAVFAGTATTQSPVLVAQVPVNHLSARYVTFQRGDGDSSHACFASKLTLTVTPTSNTVSQHYFSDTSSQPYFYWDASGSTPLPLSINGSKASITVPWDTCDWGASRGWLSLPNASTGVDAADFMVTMSQAVDINQPATATKPPDPTSVWGTTVPVPTSDVPPSIDVFGPELLQLSASDPTIRLIVQSSGPGMLQATLGSVVLGTGSLRSGNNDLRFAVPKGMLTSLRRFASDANVLTLTPTSSTGATTGTPVMLHVAIAAAPKAAKAKKHAKHKKK